MTLGAIGRLLIQALNLLNQLLGFAQDQANAADQSYIKTVVTNTQNAVASPSFGLNAIATELSALVTQVTVEHAAILAAINLTQPAANPVILPTIPPAGYGGGASAGDVWGYVLSPDNISTADMLEIAGHLAIVTQTAGSLIVANTPFMRLEGAIASEGYLFPASGPPQLNALNILSTDTIDVWLQREWGGPVTWEYDAPTDSWFFRDDGVTLNLIWRCIITAEWFARLKAFNTGTTAGINLPPIWPGLALVTLSTPVAIDVGVTITEPMDGVIVNLTSEPSKSSFFTFDDVNSYRNLGALSFFTDDDDQETATSLGFTSAIYSPKTMVRAAGVKVRTVGGVTGTITPWTITPA